MSSVLALETHPQQVWETARVAHGTWQSSGLCPF